MKQVCAFVALLSLAAAALACDQITRHYESMGCTPSSQVNDRGCPQSYSCPNLSNRQKDKCYLFGKTYAIDKDVPDELTSQVCTASVRCYRDAEDEPASLIFASIECPEFFRPWKKDCVRQHRPGRCCSSSEVCGPARDALARCTVGNKTFLEGETMEIPAIPCKTCICAKGFDEKNLEGNTNCYEQKCGYEIYYARKLVAGGIPAYREGNCCPWDWVLPSDSDELVRGSSAVANPELQCKFGKLTLNVGDSLKPIEGEKGTYNCECAIPPLLHCKVNYQV